MTLLQNLFTGLSVGVGYGVVGVGFVLVHRISGMVNFAQGNLAVAGAFGAIAAASVMPSGLATLLGGAGVGAILGVLLYALAVRPLRRFGLLIQTIVTLGVAIVIQSALQLIFGTSPHTLAPFTAGGPIRIGGASLQVQTLWLIGIALLLYGCLSFFFDRTMTGRAMSACSVNPYAAGVVGIKVASMTAIAFAISGAATGLIGAAQVPLAYATAGAGLTLGLKGFIAAILGGFDSIGLTLLGGVIVGFFESFAASTISTSYQDVIVLGALLVLLILRPSGLTRLRVSSRV